MSSGERLPSGTEIGEGCYHGEIYGAEYEDMAYKGLRGTVPPHSWAVSTTPSACYALRVFNGCCNQSYLSLSRYRRFCQTRMGRCAPDPHLRAFRTVEGPIMFWTCAGRGNPTGVSHTNPIPPPWVVSRCRMRQLICEIVAWASCPCPMCARGRC